MDSDRHRGKSYVTYDRKTSVFYYVQETVFLKIEISSVNNCISMQSL